METMRLPVGLTDEELNQRRDELARLVGKQAEVEFEKKSETKKYSDILKDIQADINDLARDIRSKSEVRGVEIETIEDYKAGVRNVIRCDTNELIKSIALTPAERQMNILSPRVSEEKVPY